MTQSNDTPRPDPLVALCRDGIDSFTRRRRIQISEDDIDDLAVELRAALDSIEEVSREEHVCTGCAGPHRFDTSIGSALWNEVIREANPALGEYLCASCIVEAFVKVGRSFEAELYGPTVDRADRTVPVIRVQVDDRPLDQSYGDLQYRLAAASSSREGAGLDEASQIATADEELRDLRDAVEIMDRKVTPFGERDDGTTSAYIVADATWHRVLAIARGSTSENARKALDDHRRLASEEQRETP